jgi:DNA replication protein DnaC
MNNFTYERLHDNLQYLKLDTIEAILDNYLELAAKDGKATIEVLDHLFEQERKHRDAAAIDRSVIEDLATLRFIHNTENIVLLGPPGVGKSHIAVAIGIEAVKAGFSAYFVNASTLIERLKKANREGILEKKIREFTKYKLLIIDEMGYLSFDEEGAQCLFQLISKRYERSSTVFTSNKTYGEWGEIFKDHVIAAAVLDRILHHCTTINIKGESYRLKERKKQGIKTGIVQTYSQSF